VGPTGAAEALVRRRPTSPRRAGVYGARNSALRRLGFDTYKQYLSSRHWLNLREHYFKARDTEKACVCGELFEVALHHLTYERIGHEELTDLRPLCKRCHSLVHVLERRGELTIDLEGLLSEQRATEYAAELDEIAQTRTSEDAIHAEEKRAELNTRLSALPLAARLAEIDRLAFMGSIDLRDQMRLLTRTVALMQRRVVNDAGAQRFWKK
jgi:hypothetical protein